MNGFWLALGFLTTLPARTIAYEPDGLGRSAAWFPIVGGLLGIILAGAALLLEPLLGGLVAAVLLVALWAGLTGGLHLDGLADCGDGLLASTVRERRLEIMRDPRVGSFGVMTLVLALLLKVAAVASLPQVGLPSHALGPALGLVLAPLWARWWILIAARQPAARPGGLGDAFAAALTPRALAIAAVLPALVTLVAAWWEWRVLAGVLLAGLACLAVVQLAKVRIGGITGDVFGAVVELAEIAFLLALVRPG